MIKTYNKGDSTYLSTNFKAKEMDCKCSSCSTTPIDEDLIKGLQKVRDHFGLPLNITSGYRCPSHNAAVGGAKASYHMKGQAADVYINGVTPKEIAQYAESTGLFKGIGRYGSFVHLDTRPNKYFWENFGSEKMVQTHGTDTLKPDAVKTDDSLYGRLYIDNVKINVGLYESNSQEVCDKQDSACYYADGKGGFIIADHNNQSFNTLKNVITGTEARIVKKGNTEVKNYKCVEAIDGHNTGSDITDNNFNSLYGKHALLMYTCKDNWQNVVIRMFDEVKEVEDLSPMISYEDLAKQIAKDVEETLKKRLSELFAG